MSKLHCRQLNMTLPVGWRLPQSSHPKRSWSVKMRARKWPARQASPMGVSSCSSTCPAPSPCACAVPGRGAALGGGTGATSLGLRTFCGAGSGRSCWRRKAPSVSAARSSSPASRSCSFRPSSPLSLSAITRVALSSMSIFLRLLSSASNRGDGQPGHAPRRNLLIWGSSTSSISSATLPRKSCPFGVCVPCNAAGACPCGMSLGLRCGAGRGSCCWRRSAVRVSAAKPFSPASRSSSFKPAFPLTFNAMTIVGTSSMSIFLSLASTASRFGADQSGRAPRMNRLIWDSSTSSASPWAAPAMLAGCLRA
mmetsp:Transcript_17008/g.48433  ORF Transcript_17008/g.48433 Transcript_17008/m.48433 type:complete len:309 (-) Transcript_17008:2-928(-)